MFRAVAVYSLDGEFVAYAIQKGYEDPKVKKLQSLNLWTEDEVADLRKQLDRLDDHRTTLDHWPDYRDPEVTIILENPDFMPVQYEAAEAVDEEKSVIVWIIPPETDPDHPYGVQDRDKSVIITKKIMAPTPASMQMRTKAAQEMVARRRSARA